MSGVKGQRMNPNSLANLVSIPKGVTLNPGGYPRGVPRVSVALGKLLRTEARESFPIINKADVIAQKLYNEALGGNVQAICTILDRTEGRVSQTLNIGAAELPTSELVARVIEAFAEVGIDEAAARQVILRLSAGDGDD